MYHHAKLIVACLVTLTAGCDTYEYRLKNVTIPPLGPEQAIAQLGQSVLRYGQETEDPVAIIAGVSLLARCPDAGESYDLSALLEQAERIHPGDPSLAALAEAVRSDITRASAASSEEVQPSWQAPPVEIGDRGTALAEPLWDLGQQNHDPLWMLCAVQIEASTPKSQLPASGTAKRDAWITNLETRIDTAVKDIGMGREDLQEIAARLSGKLSEIGRPVPVRPGEDWPGFLGKHQNGISNEQGIVTQWPIRELWQRKVGRGYAMCSVRGSYLYHFDRVGSRSRLTCLDAVTGEESWSFEYATRYADLGGYQDGPRCSPLVDGPVDEQRVYLYDADGMLHCLNAETGQVVWKVDTAKQFGVVQNLHGVAASPVIHGNLLIVVVGGSDPKYQGYPSGKLDLVKGNGTGMVAFDKLTGKVVYECSEYLAGYASPVLVNVQGAAWCFSLMREGLIGFDPDTGTIRFRHPFRPRELSGVTAATPTVTNDGQLLISAAYGLGSELLQIKMGAAPERQWPNDKTTGEHVLECLFSTPVYHKGYFYACHGQNSQDAELRCVVWNPDEKALEVKWREPGLTRVSLLGVEDHLVVLTEYGKLLLVEATPEGFKKVAEMVLREEPEPGVPPEFVAPQKLEYPCWAAPILSRGLLYVLGSGRLICLELIPHGS